MKRILFIVLLLFPLAALSQKPVAKKQVSVDTVKQDSLVVYTPTDFQLQVIQDYQKQIDELTKKEMEFILFGFGVAVDPKTLTFDGKIFKAKKQ
jgi:hypothetical protein